jgi:hypothetical protein
VPGRRTIVDGIETEEAVLVSFLLDVILDFGLFSFEEERLRREEVLSQKQR